MTVKTSTELRDLIAQLSADTPDPAVVTRFILDTLDDETAHVIAHAALHNYVRLHMVARFDPPVEKNALYETPSGQTPSSYVAGVRSWVEIELARSVCVNPSKRQYKRLQDCTIADLMAASETRMKAARRLQARAARFAKLAVAMESEQVHTVKELQREALEMILMG